MLKFIIKKEYNLKTQRKLIYLIWFAIAIQNEFFLNYKILGLEFCDIAILFSGIFLIILYNKSYKLERYVILSFLYILMIAIISYLSLGTSSFNVFRDIRNFVFLLFSFMIFSQTKIEKTFLKKMFITCGVINSFTYLLFSESIDVRNITVIIWISAISFMVILLDKEKKPFYYYGIAIFNLVIIMLSQTRTVLIPVIFTFVILIFRYVRKFKIQKLIIYGIMIFTVFLMLYELGLIDTILKRFELENVFGLNSTLTLRTDSVKYNFSGFSIFNWLFGTGFGKEILYYHNFGGEYMLAVGTDLEMLVPNYIMKLGIIPFIIMIGFIAKRITMRRHIQKSEFHKLISIVLIGLLSGGMISGLVGPEASVIIGALFGLTCNINIMEKNNV